jgi:hypothetical protein
MGRRSFFWVVTPTHLGGPRYIFSYSGVCYNERGGILSADVVRACL